MAWEVLRVKADVWSAVEFLTHWGGSTIKPRTIYARASRHRSEAAAQRAVNRLNADGWQSEIREGGRS